MMNFFPQFVDKIFVTVFFHRQRPTSYQPRRHRQEGRAHVELIVLLTCLGTLAIVTSPGQSEIIAAEIVQEPNVVAAANGMRADGTDLGVPGVTSESATRVATTASVDRLCGLGHPPMSGVKSRSSC